MYEQEAVDRKKAGKRYQGYELIKEVAGFKARVQRLAERRAEETTRRRALQQTDQFLLSTCFLDVNEFKYDFGGWRSPRNTLTLASMDRLDALCYIVSIAETVT